MITITPQDIINRIFIMPNGSFRTVKAQRNQWFFIDSKIFVAHYYVHGIQENGLVNN